MGQLPPPHAMAMAYPNGGLRITRTPGRRNTRNRVSLGDLIDKDHLVSAYIFAFYIADEELAPHLTNSTGTKDTVPVNSSFFSPRLVPSISPILTYHTDLHWPGRQQRPAPTSRRHPRPPPPPRRQTDQEDPGRLAPPPRSHAPDSPPKPRPPPLLRLGPGPRPLQAPAARLPHLPAHSPHVLQPDGHRHRPRRQPRVHPRRAPTPHRTGDHPAAGGVRGRPAVPPGRPRHARRVSRVGPGAVRLRRPERKRTV